MLHTQVLTASVKCPTLLVSSAQASCCKVKGLPDSQLCLVLIYLTDVGARASNLEAVKGLSVVSNGAMHLMMTQSTVIML